MQFSRVYRVYPSIAINWIGRKSANQFMCRDKKPSTQLLSLSSHQFGGQTFKVKLKPSQWRFKPTKTTHSLLEI